MTTLTFRMPAPQGERFAPDAFAAQIASGGSLSFSVRIGDLLPELSDSEMADVLLRYWRLTAATVSSDGGHADLTLEAVR